MADVRWIKIVTDIFDDEKILLIESMPEADAIIVIWFKLLCMAGKQNNSGVFLLNGRIAYTDEMFATIFRRPVNIVRLALNTFEQFGMIEIINDTVTIPKWEKHQQLDAMQASKEATRKRVARYREKQKQLTGGCNDDVTQDCNVTVTPSNADREEKNKNKNIKDIDSADIEGDTYIEKDTNTGGNVRAKRFEPPTVDQVDAYIREKGYSVSAERFVDYYESNGWMVGRNRMKDWKAAVRTWAGKNKGAGGYSKLDREKNRVPEKYGGGEIL